MAIALDRRPSQIQYDEHGFSSYELLAGTYEGGIRNYRCNLKAGCTCTPEMFADKVVVVMFGKGRAYVTDEKDAYNVTELSFYFPNFDRTPYSVHAIDDTEFIMSVVDMNEWDWKVYNGSHARLPLFRPISKCVIYDQDCKGPNTDSFTVLRPCQLGRILLGAVRAVGDGTREKGHPCVAQWNYCVGQSDFNLTVEDETVPTVAGDWSYVPAGLDHSLVSQTGKEAYYVWYEHFVREKDFLIKPLAKRFRDK